VRTPDAFSTILMHEVVEAITDTVPGSGITMSSDPSARPDEIEDGEPQNYLARLGGNVVQSYWSQSEPDFPNGAYVIPDGGPALIPVSNRVLRIVGDQSASPDDTITLDSVGGDEVINLNGQVFTLPVTEFTDVVVEPGAGDDTVNVEDSVHLTVFLGSG